MTPTQLIYRAWQNTPRPIIYHTHDAKGSDIETLCEFSSPEDHLNFETGWRGKCSICGAESSGGIPNGKMLSSNYTDWDKHKNPQGTHVCVACAMTMLLNTVSHRCGLFRYSFCASETLEILNRPQLRDRLLDPPKPPFVMVGAVSQKKHLAIKSHVSYTRERYVCMLEEEAIEVELQCAKDTMNVIEALRGIGFTKDEISTGKIRFDKIKDYKFDAYDKINHLLRPCMGTRLFYLCLFAAQKMNEEEAICFLDLTPRTALARQGHCSSTLSIEAETSKEGPLDTTCGIRSSGSLGARQNGQMTLQGF